MRLYQKDQQIELYIAGHKVPNFIEKTKNCPAVKWLGEVQEKEKDEFFNSIDILCVPSIDDPCPLSLIEGAMHGKVLIASDTTGSNYLIKQNINGLIVKTGNENDLYLTMEKCIKMPLHRMQKKSRKMYLKLGSSSVERKNVLKMLADNVPHEPFKIFKKIKSSNGRRRVYFCGIKIFSYKKKK